MSSGKHNKSTIFVRNLPPDTVRSELEELFSDVGPIKKCSVIRDKKDAASGTALCKGFGFVRFVSAEDAEAAVSSQSQDFVIKRENREFKLVVQSTASSSNDNHGKTEAGESNISQSSSSSSASKVVHKDDFQSKQEKSSEIVPEEAMMKRTSRIIIRNLAFTAKKSHIEEVCKKFGNIVDIHLPTVNINHSNKSDRGRRQQQQHRGFAFVTFKEVQSARDAIHASASSSILIKGRQVAIDLSMPKTKHQFQKQQEQQQQKEYNEQNTDHDTSSSVTEEKEGQAAKDSDEEQKDDNNSTSSSSGTDDDESSVSSSSSSEEESESVAEKEVNTDVKENCTIFVRNIPFDADRHSMFMLFKKFGRINGVYLVIDKPTGVMKGTAFIKFANEKAAKRALDAGKAKEDAPFVAGKDAAQDAALSHMNDEDDGIYYNGRRLLVDLAVDRNTADTLRVERDETGKAVKKAGKDRRNLYLKLEGYIGNDERNEHAWRNIPEVDKEKRARASSEKSTKLRSPLFFINPYRLSVRNLAKHIDESELKKLIVKGIKEGLRRKLVQAEDMTVQLRAQGLAPRDCVGDAAKIPLFDDKDIKSFVPSVYIGRDVVASVGKKPEVGQSKGFAFIEFTHHTHALACLRELNNNPAYSEKFAIFGKKAAEAKKSGRRAGLGDGFFNDEGKLLIPRLIVDFTVENKAKAKQQQQRRELQIKNHLKQKQNSKEAKIKNDEVKKDKKGRGSLQREKKRKLKELGESDSKVKTKQKKTKKPLNEKEQAEKKVVKERVKKVKPPKKRKVDNEAVEFDNMVRSYKNAFGLNMESTEKVEKDNPRDVVSKKRWYE